MNPNEIATRRAFLHRGLTLVSTAATVPYFLDHAAWSIARAESPGSRPSRRDGGRRRVLVVVQLGGGNDGLNTVVPIGNDIYYKVRPRLAIARKDAIRIDDGHGLHPSLTGLKALYDQGLLATIETVGYPNPNRSHFKSMDIWQTASPEGRLHTGWIGRYFDATCKGEDRPEPEAGLALTTEAPLAMRGEKFAPVAFQRPEELAWRGEVDGGTRRRGDAEMPAGGPVRIRERKQARGRGRGGLMAADNHDRDNPLPQDSPFARLNSPDPAAGRVSPELTYLQRTALDARMSAADIQQAARGNSSASYPNSPVANSLKTVARLIASDLPTRVYYASHGGYDTHANQAPRQEQLLGQLSAALKAFVDDLTASRTLDRVTIMTFSEFGRRVAENGSGGTDHGTAAPMFVIGKHVKPGFHGRPPDLQNLQQGDLAFSTDFRTVYAAVLRDWLAVDPGPILAGPFTPLPQLFARA